MKHETKIKVIAFLNGAMIQKERDNKNKYYCFNEETAFKPYWEEIKNILFKAGFEVQDSYYRFLSEAFYNIGYYLKYEDDLKGFEDNINEYCEADIYNSDLLNWVSENVYNAEYINQAVEELGFSNPKEFNFFDLLRMGQQRHKEEVYFMALDVIKYLVGVFDEE